MDVKQLGQVNPPPSASTIGLGDGLLIVGSVSTDHLSTAADSRVQTLGGAGLYAALGAAVVATAPVRLVGVVGRDIADSALDLLHRRVAGTALLVYEPGLRFDITYDHEWRARYVVDGAEAEMAIDDALVHGADPRPGAVHLCPTGPPVVQRRLAAGLRATYGQRVWLSATTFANRIRTHPADVRALWHQVDLLVCDVVEITLLTGQDDLVDAFAVVSENLRLDAAVCVTDAHRGAYLVTAGAVTQIPAYSSRTVDPTGAGECFAGALAAARLGGHSLLQSATIAAAAASLVVEDFGVGRLADADPVEVHRRAAVLASTLLAGRAHHD